MVMLTNSDNTKETFLVYKNIVEPKSSSIDNIMNSYFKHTIAIKLKSRNALPHKIDIHLIPSH
jgi:hypothetical protein